MNEIGTAGSLQLLPQRLDMSVHSSGFALIGEAPNLFQQPVAGNGRAAVAYQIGQQFELLIGENDLRFQIDHGTLVQVNGQGVSKRK